MPSTSPPSRPSSDRGAGPKTASRRFGLSNSRPAPAARSSWWADFSAFWLRDPRRRLQLVGWICALWLLVFTNQWLHIGKDIARPQRYLGVNAETVYVPPVTALRVASLGHQSFVADLLFVRVAHYFVNHLLSDSQLPFIDLYLEAIWGLDAHNRTTYRWGAQVIKFGQKIDESVNARANRFARLGLEHFPEDGWLYHEIAYNLFAYKHRYDDVEAARREALALEYLALAYQMPGFSFDPNYLAHQYARAGRTEDSVAAAMASYAAGTGEQRRELRVRLRQRDKAAAADTLAWLDHDRKRDWPYVGETLSLLLGPRRQVAPPTEYGVAENWLPERPVDPALLKQLGIADLRPPRGVLDPATQLDSDEAAPEFGRVSPPAPPPPAPPPRHVFNQGAPVQAPDGRTPPAAAPAKTPTQETP